MITRQQVSLCALGLLAAGLWLFKTFVFPGTGPHGVPHYVVLGLTALLFVLTVVLNVKFIKQQALAEAEAMAATSEWATQLSRLPGVCEACGRRANYWTRDLVENELGPRRGWCAAHIPPQV